MVFSLTAAQTGDVAQEVRLGLEAAGVTDVEVEGPPRGLEEAYRYLLTPTALQFVADLTRHFNDQVDRVSIIGQVMRCSSHDSLFCFSS